MGTAHRWRPAIHLAITLPIIRAERSAGTEVTTRILDMRIGDPAAPAGVVLRIEGHCARRRTPGRLQPVARGGLGPLETLAGSARPGPTDAPGPLQLGELQPVPTRLRPAHRHRGRHRVVSVPGDTGSTPSLRVATNPSYRRAVAVQSLIRRLHDEFHPGAPSPSRHQHRGLHRVASMGELDPRQGPSWRAPCQSTGYPSPDYLWLRRTRLLRNGGRSVLGAGEQRGYGFFCR